MNRMMGGGKFGFIPFMSSQIFFFVVIVLVSTNIMGILSYKMLAGQTEERAIESNNKLLAQYSNTIDTLILNNVKETLNRILQDISDNPDLNYYLRNPIAGKVVDLLKVSQYLEDIKLLNPIIYSVAIYYKKESILVTSEKIRYLLKGDTAYEAIKQQSIQYYDDLLGQAVAEKPEIYCYVLDKGENMQDQYSAAGNVPSDVLHIIRTINGADGEYGSIVVTIDIEALNYMMKNYAPAALDSIMIVDDRGVILSHTNTRYIGENIAGLADELRAYQSEAGSGYYTVQSGGTASVISYQTSTNRSWKYIATTPMFTVRAAAGFIIKILVVSALLSLGVGIVVSLLAARFLSKPIRTITRQCASIALAGRTAERNEYSIISGTLTDLTETMRTKERLISEIIPMLRSNFINWIITNRPSLTEIGSQMKIMKVEFPYRNFCVAAVKIGGREGEGRSDYDYEYEKTRMGLLFEKEFNTDSSLCILSRREDILLAMINYACDRQQLFTWSAGILQSEDGRYRTYIAFGSAISEITHIYRSWEIAECGLNYSYVFPERHLLKASEIEAWESGGGGPGKLLINNFINSVKSLNKEKSLADLGALIGDIRRGSYGFRQISAALISCVYAVENFLLIRDSEQQMLSNDILRETTDIGEFSRRLSAVIEEEFDRRGRKDVNSAAELVNSAREYINVHLFDPQMSLNTVAQALGVSSNYLSRIFHSEYSITFVEYITNLKLSYSRNLVVNTDLKIGEIADRMGYSTAQYFISSFRKKFGITPNLYRKNQGLGK